MKIYVVETLGEDTCQIGFSTSKKVAEEQAKQYEKNIEQCCWVSEYTIGKSNWTEFD